VRSVKLYIVDRKRAAGYMLKITWILVLVLSFGLISRSTTAAYSLPMRSAVVVIDAGHGGRDPGASGASGLTEEEVALNIAMKLRRLVEQGGGTAIMIREDDSGLYTEGGDGKQTRKHEDLMNRRALINSCGADIFISIHLDSFPQPQYFGAQAIYLRGDEKSRLLAEGIQKELIKILNNNNRRTAKSTDTLFLLKNNSIPGTLVECGFLSNREEERLLGNDHYQEKIAWSIFVGIVKYMEAEKRTVH